MFQQCLLFMKIVQIKGEEEWQVGNDTKHQGHEIPINGVMGSNLNIKDSGRDRSTLMQLKPVWKERYWFDDDVICTIFIIFKESDEISENDLIKS